MSPPVPLDNIQVTAIGSVNLRALPAAFQYTGTEAEINSAMFTDMDNAYDLLINVAGRPRAASPGETPTVTGLSRADFTQLYRTISQIDPRQPALDIQSALSTNLMAMGFTEAEIRDLANNPARLQMLARVSYAASDNTQFGAIAALDGPTTPTPTTTAARAQPPTTTAARARPTPPPRPAIQAQARRGRTCSPLEISSSPRS